jgi:hypothetical protein
VAFPLLGADFLTHFALSVDLAKFCVRTRTGRKFGLVAPPASSNFALLGMRPAAVGAASGTASTTPQLPSSSSSPSASGAGLPRSLGQVAAAAKPAHKAASPTVVHQATATKPAHTAASPSPLHLPSSRSTTAALQGMAASSAVTGAASRYQQILKQYPAVLCQSKELPPVKHSVLHHIETEG